LLDYNFIYMPGKFGENSYNYHFSFSDEFGVFSSNNLLGCTKDENKKRVSYNCELNKFKPAEKIEIKFRNLSRENIFSNFSIVFLAILFSLFYGFVLFRNKGIAQTYLLFFLGILIPLLLSFIDSNYLWWKPLFFVLINLIVLLIILNLNEKNKRIRCELLKFNWSKN
ncbi:MAG: hypothetical protein ACOC1P_05510, partial [Minisyncoccales bacterium]